MKDILIQSYLKIQHDLTNCNTIDKEFSGTTCVTTFINKNKIYCANAGDSRAIIGKFNRNRWTNFPLSKDHKPEKFEEKKRILQFGGHVEPFKGYIFLLFYMLIFNLNYYLMRRFFRLKNWTT